MYAVSTTNFDDSSNFAGEKDRIQLKLRWPQIKNAIILPTRGRHEASKVNF